MISTIIGILFAFYKFATKAIVNDPLKGQIDLAIKDANGYLVMIKDVKPSETLADLSKFSTKMILFSVSAFIIINLLLPKGVVNDLNKLTLGIAGTSILLKLSIDWIQEHRKSIKEIFFNIQNIGLLFAPLIVYSLGSLLQMSSYDKDFEYLRSQINTGNILIIQLYWFLTLVIIVYFGFWIIAAPIYFMLRIFIFICSLALRKIDKHVDHNIIEGICWTLGLIGVVLKAAKL